MKQFEYSSWRKAKTTQTTTKLRTLAKEYSISHPSRNEDDIYYK
jgi:hypothetical protein